MVKSTFEPEKLKKRVSLKAGILIVCAGFEDRALAFADTIDRTSCRFLKVMMFKYISQREDNLRNCYRLEETLKLNTGKRAQIVEVDANRPVMSFQQITKSIRKISEELVDRTAIIDISGMTHMWALAAMHACLDSGLRTRIVYTEAQSYFPLRREAKRLVEAWHGKDYEKSEKYLQSAALKAIHVLPSFAGNFRPGRQTCLMVFAGYEPNRLEGLVDDYAPGALVVLYGKSPHKVLAWRTSLSRQLHDAMFSGWRLREVTVSTWSIDEILATLENEFQAIRSQYDVAISPHNSKLQGIAAYLFWRRHPEVQLIFTSPARFNPTHYSSGNASSYIFEIT